MTVQTRWLKPYARIQEGVIPDAVVAVGRRVWWSNMSSRQYTYLVIVDLWFVKLRIQWLGRRG